MEPSGGVASARERGESRREGRRARGAGGERRSVHEDGGRESRFKLGPRSGWLSATPARQRTFKPAPVWLVFTCSLTLAWYDDDVASNSLRQASICCCGGRRRWGLREKQGRNGREGVTSWRGGPPLFAKWWIRGFCIPDYCGLQDFGVEEPCSVSPDRRDTVEQLG